MSFAAPMFLWALLAVPLVVLLHFLRIERTRREVAALFLWREAQEMAEARRKTSPTWLLLVQVLFVTAAALALAQPRISFAGPPDAVLVLDASASMTAREPNGRTRLDAARAEASAVAGRSGRVAVVRAGLDATVVHPLDDDRAALERALGGLAAGDRRADLERALELAEDVAAGGRVHVFTDAEVAPREGLTVHPVGSAVLNAGIVAFDVGLQEAFVAVATNDVRPMEVEVGLLLDGEAVASTSLFVPAGGQGTATFPLSRSGIYEARLTPPAGDALALDDVAYAGRPDLLVTIDRPNEPLQRALAALPGVGVRVTAADAAADVRVRTGVDPAGLEPGRYIVVAEPAAEPDYRIVRDVDRAHPLMRFADVREAVVGISPGWPPEEPADEGGEAWTVLARDASLTPLIRYRDDGERQVLQLGFHPSQTDLILRPAFPALIANAIRAFRGEDRLPLGAVVEAAVGATRVLEPGIYEVGGRERAVSLLSVDETRLREAPQAADVEPRDAPVWTERARGLAPWLLAAALAALAAEWWLSRRSRWWALGGR